MARAPTITELEEGKGSGGDARDSINYGRTPMAQYATRPEWVEYALKCRCRDCMTYLASRR